MEKTSATVYLSQAEQFIAQHLKFINAKTPEPELFYWLHKKRKGAAEIDFMYSRGGEIFPIEGKAGKTGKIKSLWKYIELKKLNSYLDDALA